MNMHTWAMVLLSARLLRWNGLKFLLMTSLLRLECLEGYALPLSQRGLAYMKSFGPPSDQDLTSYHHAIFTYPEEWDPSVLDHEYSAHDAYSYSVVDSDSSCEDPMFNDYGELNQHVIANLNTFLGFLKTQDYIMTTQPSLF